MDIQKPYLLGQKINSSVNDFQFFNAVIMEDILIGYVAIWLIMAFIVASIGSDRELGYWGTFAISLILSPIVAIIAVLISKRTNGGIGVHRYKSKLDEAKKAVYKGQNEIAIDLYMDALYFLENDYKDIKGEFGMKRMDLIGEIKAKVEELKK